MENWESLIKTCELHGIDQSHVIKIMMETMVRQLDSLNSEDDTCLGWLGLNWKEEDVAKFYDGLLKNLYGE